MQNFVEDACRTNSVAYVCHQVEQCPLGVIALLGSHDEVEPGQFLQELTAGRRDIRQLVPELLAEASATFVGMLDEEADEFGCRRVRPDAVVVRIVRTEEGRVKTAKRRLAE